MTPIEHYLIKTLNVKKDSNLMQELINYLLMKDYEIDFEAMSASTNAIVTLKSQTSRCHIWHVDDCYVLYEKETILDPESYFYGSLAFERTTIRKDLKHITINKNFYDPTDDAGIVHEIEYWYHNNSSRGIVKSLSPIQRIDLRAINKLHDLLTKKHLLLLAANQEIMKESSKVLRKSDLDFKNEKIVKQP